MNRHERRRQAKTERILIKDIKMGGPIQHPTLPPMLMLRIQRLHGVLVEHVGMGLGEWVEGFQRDLHPEREVIIWEGLARALESFTKARGLGPLARGEVYKLLLTQMSGAVETNDEIQELLSGLRHISPEDAIEVAEEYNKAWAEVRQETGFDKTSWAIF
jgi:hypothetical protein